MKGRYAQPWIPFWADKWLWGSMRVEFNIEERGIWIDLLAVATKDNGFIRANEDYAYPIHQLAGMLIIPEAVLKAAIDKFIDKEKITKQENGVLYITKWDDYQLSDRHRRRFKEDKAAKEDTVTGKPDTPPPSTDTNSNNKEEYNIKEPHEKLAVLMESYIKDKIPKHYFSGNYLESWGNTFRIMIEKKEATFDEMKDLMDWIYKDSFWYSNILSADKFRKQLGRIWERAKGSVSRSGEYKASQIGRNNEPLKPKRTREEIALIPRIKELYKEEMKKAMKKRGWKTVDDIDYFKVPMEDDFIESKLMESRNQEHDNRPRK